MQASGPVCAQCGQVAAPGVQYCTRCGEAVDPTLVAELQRLYTTLRELNVRVVSGRGSQTVSELRDELRARYLALRTEPGKEKTSPIAAPLAAAQAPAAVSAAPVSAPDRPSAAPPSAPIRPPRPAFSWQAFLAEQAIAIMAYLGAFLLIIATLAFELGGWQGLPDSIKLALMVVVYLIFGALGIVLRRARGLRTVGNAYLGVFALMTPLIALGVYRFELQSTGFPVAGMLCIAALYATVIYVALALRTSFATYAYLGWVALLVAVIATVPWSGVAAEWWVFALVSVAAALLFPDQISQLQIAALLGRPARQVSAVASSVGVVSVEVLGLLVWLERTVGQVSVSIAAFALAAVVLAALAVGWSATMRQWMPHATWLLTTLEASVGALAAQAVIALAAWSGAKPSQMAYVLAFLGLAEMGAALVLRRVAPARAGLRYSVEGIALALTSLAALSVVAYPSPNWPLTAAYTVGILVTIGIVVAEGAPWWLLASGFFLTLVYQTIGTAILPPSHLAQDASPFYAALTLALWLLALGCGLRGVTRKFAAPIYVVAFGDALYTCLLLIFRREPGYQTAVLLIFALAAFIAARRERQPLVGGLAVGFFGVLACLPWAFSESNTLYGSFLAVGVAVAALAVRRTLGRPWALPLYGVGLWAILLAGVHASVPGVTTEKVVALDLPFAAWLLIVYTALALVGAFWEGAPWAATVPAALGLWAMFVTGERVSAVALLFGLVVVGAASRQWRGQWWGAPWYVAGAVGSVFVVLQLDQYGAAGRDGQVALLLALAPPWPRSTRWPRFGPCLVHRRRSPHWS